MHERAINDATFSRLAAMVVEVSDVVHDSGDVHPESRLSEDLGLSSLMAVNLVVDLERTFDIVIREEDFDGVRTVGDLMQVVERGWARAALSSARPDAPPLAAPPG